MKTVGVIGGLGPETTGEFYMRLLEYCFQQNKQTRPEILIDSIEMDLQKEQRFIKGEDESDFYLKQLKRGAQNLAKAGADFLVIPCNTVHIFLQEIRDSVQLPILSIVEVTVDKLKKQDIHSVGLLATKHTLQTNLYTTPLREAGITVVIPEQTDQENIGSIINNLVRSKHTDKDYTELNKVISRLHKRNIEAILLACTDLQLLEPKHPNTPIFDTMRFLVEATGIEILS